MDEDIYVKTLLSALRQELRQIDREIVLLESGPSVRQPWLRSPIQRGTRRELGRCSIGRRLSRRRVPAG